MVAAARSVNLGRFQGSNLAITDRYETSSIEAPRSGAGVGSVFSEAQAMYYVLETVHQPLVAAVIPGSRSLAAGNDSSAWLLRGDIR